MRLNCSASTRALVPQQMLLRQQARIVSKRLDAARATHESVIPRPHDMREIDSAVKRLDESRGADETAAMIRPRQGLWQDRSGRCTQQQHASSRAWRRVPYDVQGSAFSWASNLGRCYGAPDPASRGSRRARATTQAGHVPSRLAARRSPDDHALRLRRQTTPAAPAKASTDLGDRRAALTALTRQVAPAG